MEKKFGNNDIGRLLMNITTKGRYALRIMIDLAQNGGTVSLSAVSQRQGISMKYLESIVSVLLSAGYVESHRGKNGGYCLAKEPKDCCIADLLRVTEGSLAPVSCLDSGCPNAEGCITLPLWAGLDRRIDGYLKGITLEDVLNGTVPE